MPAVRNHILPAQPGSSAAPPPGDVILLPARQDETQGLPRPPALMRAFALNPPQLRPGAWPSLAPPFLGGAGSVGTHTHDSAAND